MDHLEQSRAHERDLYDPVPHSHVVPTGYLKAWAHGKQIAMWRVSGSASQVIGIRDAGVRKNFYRRDRPATGETIYDIEWSLQEAETAALPVIADLARRWPLSPEDRGKVGQFFALQHLRGAAFRNWHEEQIAAVLNEARTDAGRTLKPHPGRTHAEVIDELETQLTSDTYRLTKMLKLVRSVGIVFTSMQWSLVEFDRGRLVTSDHPVVVWPLVEPTTRRPSANDLDAGVIDTREVFVPVGPAHLLLMGWRDQQSIGSPIAGRGRHLATANAFVVANAASQWFYEPGVRPWLARGRRPPLSSELLGVEAAEVTASRRRAKARELANAEVLRELSNDPVQVVDDDRLPVRSA